jgi:putative ABC transport system substrate-binding protein
MPVTEMNDRAESNRGPYRAFFGELRRLGYVEGQNLLIERYSGEGRAVEGGAPYYPGLARDVVRRNPDLIFAIGNQMVLDFKVETTTIAIVGTAAASFFEAQF